MYLDEKFIAVVNRQNLRSHENYRERKTGWHTWSTYGTFDRALERLSNYLAVERSIPNIPHRNFRIVNIKTGTVEFSSALL